MERERAEVAQELLLKAHVMANHSAPSRKSPLKMHTSPTPSRYDVMRVQDLNSTNNSKTPPSLEELAQLHHEALGQLKDVSCLYILSFYLCIRILSDY
jgi:hypothetical protein